MSFELISQTTYIRIPYSYINVFDGKNKDKICFVHIYTTIINVLLFSMICVYEKKSA